MKGTIDGARVERKGRVVFIDPDMVNGLGDVALKLRY